MEKEPKSFETPSPEKEKTIAGLTAEDVDGFYVLEGSQDSYFYQPEKFAMVVDSAFYAMDAKRKKREEVKKQTELPENAPK